MTNPATTDDLESRWRPLSVQETTNAQTFLDDAWLMLRRRFPGLADDVLVDADLAAEAVRVMATAVLRVLKNPDGMRQESIDDYSWTRDQAVSAGLLYFADGEFDALYPDSSTTGAFSFSMLPSSYPDSRWPTP
jgi:hypothetical protein